MTTELKIEVGGDLALWVGPGDLVQVPMDSKERALCREALEGALSLLNQTIVKYPTLSTGAEMGAVEIRNLQRPGDCLGVFDCSHPSGPQVGSQEPRIQLVKSD